MFVKKYGLLSRKNNRNACNWKKARTSVLMNYALIVFCSTGNKLFVRTHKIKLTANYIPIVLGNFVYKIYCKSAHK